MSEAAEDADRFGLPAEIAAQLDSKEKSFAIWPANMHIVNAFVSVSSQWLAIPLANGRVHWAGLNYPGVRIGLEQADIALTPSQWSGLQAMERAAAAALNGYRE